MYFNGKYLWYVMYILSPVGAPTSYLRTGFLQILHLTRIEKIVLERTETPGCKTFGKRVANEKLSAVSPLDPLLCT